MMRMHSAQSTRRTLPWLWLAIIILTFFLAMTVFSTLTPNIFAVYAAPALTP